MASSVSNFSFRYHPEDEELDDNYDTSTSISTSNITIKSEGTNEEMPSNVTGESPSVLGRLGIREPESDKWKLLSRITKSVEEKLVEIKTERLKSQSNQRRVIPEQSSVSDSEDPSESSQLSVSDKSSKSAQDTLKNHSKMEEIDDIKQKSDPSDSQGSSPERTSVQLVCPEQLIEEENNASTKKGKGLKGVLKRKKGKTKNEKNCVLDKTTISYSALVDNESDSETIEVAEEVREEISDTQLARELDRLAHPTLFHQIVYFVTNWHMFLLPLSVVLISHVVHLPQYLVGFVSGIIVLLALQKFIQLIKEVLGLVESTPSLPDILPLTGMPIFRRSTYYNDQAETKFEGWMNEYNREYQIETYHMTLTDTVWVTLEGSLLKLSSTRCKIPKRALWNEPRYKLQFTHERLFDITNCKVELKPEGLILRRIWSKKYPISITLNPTSRLGVRYKENDEETVDEDAPWVDESKYNFDTLSEDSDDELPNRSSVCSEQMYPKKNDDEATLNSEIDENLSVDSMLVEDPETPDIDVADPDDFVKVMPVAPQGSVLYLFARTHREKEIWFRRLVSASKGLITDVSKSSNNFQDIKSEDGSVVKVPKLDYLSFMMKISQRTAAHLPQNKEQNSKTSNPLAADLSISSDMMWVNAFIGRVLFDVYQDPETLINIQEKIQKKLSAIKLPSFLEQLEVRQLELGETVPVVQRASRPVLNSQGVWVELDIAYEGGFKMTVNTKLNMDRIRQTQPESPTSDCPRSPTPTQLNMERKSAAYDSQVEDSAETSSEEPDTSRLGLQATPVAQSKLIRYLDKVAQSKAIQRVIDYKFVKKFVEDNNLQLEVEVKGLLGTLVFNIPPPPSDRIWFGFRTNPKLWLSAHPKFGQHAVQVISRIIEKKLALEFQRVLVLPNMEDILVPLMDHNRPS